MDRIRMFVDDGGRGHRDVSVLDGGPDTWAESRGQRLVVGE